MKPMPWSGALLLPLLLLPLACVKEINSNVKSVAPDVPAAAAPTLNQQNPEGVINGGGGTGLLCTEADGQKRVHLLDLKEGEVIYHLKYTGAPKDDQDAAFDFAATRLAAHFWNGISPDTQELVGTRPALDPSLQSREALKAKARKMIDELHRSLKFVKGPQTSLKDTRDAHAAFSAENCQPIQIATYYDETVLSVDQAHWDGLDWLGRTALLIHEISYQYDRTMNQATDSKKVRRFVAHLLSDRPLRPLIAIADKDLFDKTLICGPYSAHQDSNFSIFAFNFLVLTGAEEKLRFIAIQHPARFDLFAPSFAAEAQVKELTVKNLLGEDDPGFGSYEGVARIDAQDKPETFKISSRREMSFVVDTTLPLNIKTDEEIFCQPLHCFYTGDLKTPIKCGSEMLTFEETRRKALADEGK